MKKKGIIIVVTLFLALSGQPVFAQFFPPPTPPGGFPPFTQPTPPFRPFTPPPTPFFRQPTPPPFNNFRDPRTGQSFTDRELENQRRRTESTKQRTINEIDRLINNLNNLKGRIASARDVTDAQKSQMISSIDAQIAQLNDLKGRIQGMQDPAPIENELIDVRERSRGHGQTQNIIGITQQANKIIAEADKLNESAARIRPRLESARGWGQNIEDAETAFNNMQGRINNAKTLANNAINRVVNLPPNEAGNRQSAVLEARAMLVEARREVQLARLDKQRIIGILQRSCSDFRNL